MKKKIILPAFLILLSSLLLPMACQPQEWDVLSPSDKRVFYKIRVAWETWVPQLKEKGDAPLITFEQLYQGLGPEEKDFLDRVRAIKPSSNTTLAGEIAFTRIEGQMFEKDGKQEAVGPQYLPKNVYEAYELMMEAMQKDIGKRLLIESGYRSPAYQLYTFLFYLPKHGYSLRETREWVALPGHSEHGDPHRQAIDFMSVEGINSDYRMEDFERLPEYLWLLANASKFGFELSYPRGTKGTNFEPWHWRYIKGSPAKSS